MSRHGAYAASVNFLPPSGGGQTTPSQQASSLSIFSRETEQDLTWNIGNGTARVVIGKAGSPVDIGLLVDGVELTANPIFGSGQELGTGNFVLYAGTGAAETITGLTADSRYYYDVYEYNTDGFKYLTTIDTNTIDEYTAYVYDDLFNYEGGGDPPGQTLFETASDWAYDWTLLTGSDASVISGGNAGLVDQGPNGEDLTPLNSVAVNDVTLPDLGAVKSFRAVGDDCMDTGNYGDGYFGGAAVTSRGGFETFALIQVEDGIHASTNRLFGASNSADTQYQANILGTSGKLQITYQVPGSFGTWESTAALLPDGLTTQALLRIKFDFGTGTLSVWLDEVPVSGSFTVGNLTSVNPTGWNMAPSGRTIVIGSVRFASISNNSASLGTSFIRMCNIRPLTTQEAADLSDFMTTGGSSSSGLTEYTEQQTVGYSLSVVSNELVLDGNPFFWRDWVSHNEWESTMEDFEIEMRFRINSVSTDTAGIGIGIRNDVETEANRAVVADFNMDTNHASYGKIQLSAGNGSSSSPNSISQQAQSSAAFAPIAGETYTANFNRAIQSNDASYSVKLSQYVDGTDEDPFIDASWIEIGRPSSSFFATTTRSWIHVNGCDVSVEYFLIRRTAEPTVTPPPETADVYLSTTGSDSNDGYSIDQPVLTPQVAVTQAVALGGTRTISASAGVYPMIQRLSVPVNISIIGAGRTLTIFQGQSQLFDQAPSGTSHTTALFILNTGGASTDSHVSGNQTLQDFTIDGNLRRCRQGLYVNNRDDITVTNVGIRNVNQFGAWVRFCADSTFDMHIESAGGDTHTTPNCNNMNPQVATGAANTGVNFGALATWCLNNVTFTGSIDNSMFRSGYGHKSYNASGHTGGYYIDTTFDGMTITVNPQSNYFGQSGIMLMTINLEFHVQNIDNLFNLDNLIVQDCVINGGFMSIAPKSTPAQTGETHIRNNQFYTGLWPAADNRPIPVCESHLHKLKFYGNYAEASELVWTTNSYGIFPYSYEGWEIYNNIIEAAPANYSQMGVLVKLLGQPLIGAHIHNNTVVFTGSTGSAKPLIRLDSTAGKSSIIFENNAIYGQPPVSTNIWNVAGGTGGLVSSIARYNKATHANVNQAVAGLTVSNSTVTGAGNTLGFNLTGSKFPIVSGSYYAWPTGNTVLKNAGYLGADIGAYED